MFLSADGFYKPDVDKSLCVNCGLCIDICYKYDSREECDLINACKGYSARNRDRDTLMKSSSGGVSIELMRRCLKLGYWIVGVAYDYEKDLAVTKISKSEQELEAFHGSKYFQSSTEAAFRTIVSLAAKQKFAVFGTPCQIYAIKRFAEKKRILNQFLLVDLFCHGCPSLNLWKKCLEEQKKICRVDKFEHIMFRSKDYGWHEFSNTFFTVLEKQTSKRNNDPFYTLFFLGQLYNEACFDCSMRSKVNAADIRVGDYWGWRFDRDNEGVSALIAITPKGEQLIDAVSDRIDIRSQNIEEILNEQSYGKAHELNVARREQLLHLLHSDLSASQILRATINSMPYSWRLKQSAKNLLKYLPLSVYGYIRKKKHQC